MRNRRRAETNQERGIWNSGTQEPNTEFFPEFLSSKFKWSLPCIQLRIDFTPRSADFGRHSP
jgi:hypothetical protein